ncbi:MAG: DnaD domain protein [Oscillospiraceae bacterium]|nr:DnaD domain protein [Oscillospiraceae bacterium]MBR7055595.1 DnaD domain protein [Oscillospiraceae bacterium]
MAERYLPVPLADLDKLLAAADGNAALLWLHVLRTGGFSLGRAARELKCTETELLAAAAALRSLGLLRDPPESQEPPEYSAEDLARRADADPSYRAAVAETEQALGRVLNANDLRLLYAIFDFWGLPPDVIMLLVHYCVEKYQTRYGPGRTPTMRYVEREARFWSGCEVRSLDDAEQLITREREREQRIGQLKAVLQIRGRELTKTEREYAERWIGMGFTPEAVALAYDQTVVATGRLTWRYLDRVLESWQERGLMRPEDIEAAQGRRARAAERPARSEEEKIDAMRRMLAHGKEKRDGT